MRHLKREKTAPKFIYFDFETHNWSQTICVCARDESGGKRIRARSMESLLETAEKFGWLTTQYTWMAHYGGIFDFLLVLAKAFPEWSITRGIHGAGFGTWSLAFRSGSRFLCMSDSARLFSGALRDWGELVGISKGEVDRKTLLSLPWNTVADYCMRDTDILAAVHERMRSFFREISPGTEIRATLSATIAAIVRRECIPEDEFGWVPEQDIIAANAYYGGRVERFRKTIASGWEFDINSSYPYAMTLPLPTYFRGQFKTEQKGACNIIEATVDVPEDTYIGTLPTHTDKGPLAGKLLFPTGTFRGYWCDEELYASANTRVLLVHRVLAYDRAPWLAPLMERLYAYRKRMDALAPDGKSLDGAFAKLAMNSVSGKLIQREDNWFLTQDPDAVERFENARDEDPTLPAPRPYRIHKDGGYHLIAELCSRRDAPMRHAAAGAYVTARGRVALLSAMESSQKGLAYCDTDSVHISGKLASEYVDAKRLGAFKNCGEIIDGQYIAPKVYAYTRDSKFSLHAKGFRFDRPDLFRRSDESDSEHRKRTAKEKLEYDRRLREGWRNIVAGNPVAFETTRLLKSSLKAGSLEFVRHTVTRKRDIDAIDKREFIGEESRPWNLAKLPL